MDANVYNHSRQSGGGRTSLSAFADEIEGELEKRSICGVHLTRKVVLSIIGLVVGISLFLAIGLSGSPKIVDPSGFTGAENHRYWSLGALIESSVGKDIYDNNTTKHDALLWLAEMDPQRLDSSHPLEELVQRYVLAYFYFSTNGNEWAHNKYHFLSGKNVCKWNDGKHGVFCNDRDQVTSVIMPATGLQGEIPHDIGLLSHMETLNLTENSLRGTIPPSIGIFSSMTTFDLSKNEISGPIPKSVGMLHELVTLDFSFNKLSGSDDVDILHTLPKLEELRMRRNSLSGKIGQFGGSSSLRVIDLSFNKFNGAFSTKVPEGQALEVLRVNHNNLWGTMPGSFGKFINLKELDVSNNKISGTFPTEIGGLSMLETLKLNSNTFESLPTELGQLENLSVLEAGDNGLGSFPSEILDLFNLKKLSLPSNNFSGEFPHTVGFLSSLTYLDFSFNKFQKELPREVHALQNLEYLYLNNNNFDGEIPEEVSGYPMLKELDLSMNKFVGDLGSLFCDRPKGSDPIEFFRADCLGDLVNVPCATECCDGYDHCCPADQLDCRSEIQTLP